MNARRAAVVLSLSVGLLAVTGSGAAFAGVIPTPGPTACPPQTPVYTGSNGDVWVAVPDAQSCHDYVDTGIYNPPL